MEECSITDCHNPVYSRTWCNMHYQRWKRNGDPEIRVRYRGEPEASFWAKVDKGDGTGCWNWTATKTRGYGMLRVHGGQMSAHRFSYLLHHGAIPDGADVDHLCRNHSCVNPAHLEAVTHRENVIRGISPLARQAAMTECGKGHPFTSENTYVIPSTGARVCRTCQTAYRAANKDKYNAARRVRRRAAPKG